MAALRRVFIANRGEIAQRIVRACQAVGAESVACAPADDAASLHTLSADRAVTLPGAGAAAYLDARALVRAAVEAGCSALHPGVGFLSESAQLAALCDEHGVTFVGPSARALALCGDKARARDAAAAAGLRVLPGARVASADEAAARFGAVAGARRRALLKALAGGGGKGIRLVEGEAECAAQFARCESEAARAFGDGRLLLERALARPRHVEVQLAADRAGRVVHFGERDCSVQRRHQKLVEICPAPRLADATRAALRARAARLGRELAGAGLRCLATVEFLLDADGDGGEPQLQRDEVDARDELGDGVLDLQARVDL